MPSICAHRCPVCLLALAGFASADVAMGDLSPVIQERSVQTQVMVSSGQSASDMDEAGTFGPFSRTVTSGITGAAGASADATASQTSSIGAAGITGQLSALGAAATGATFITGDANSQSNLLVIFSLSESTPVQFLAAGSLAFVGRNPDGEPSDLSGLSRVRLINAVTEEVISGFQLNGDAATDSAMFSGTLAPGQYVILASAQMHVFSADLLGPPARSGSGTANASFSLTIVPAPGAAALFGISGLFAVRRRRVH